MLCLVHITVVLVGTIYLSIVVIQLVLQHMRNPLRYEEGRSVCSALCAVAAVVLVGANLVLAAGVVCGKKWIILVYL